MPDFGALEPLSFGGLCDRFALLSIGWGGASACSGRKPKDWRDLSKRQVSKLPGHQRRTLLAGSVVHAMGKLVAAILKVGALILVGALAVVFWQYGTISPCGILRVQIQKSDKIAAALPAGLVEWGMQAEYGSLTPGRCIAVLLDNKSNSQHPNNADQKITNSTSSHVEHYMPTPEQRREIFIDQTNQLIGQMQQADSQIDGTLEKLPGGETHYHAITAKVQSLYEKAKALPGDRYGVTRGQIIVAMNQGTVATDQLNIKVQSIKTNYTSHVEPLLNQLAKAQRNCPSSDGATDQACRLLQGAGDTFKNKCQTLSAGLQNLDKTYQTELSAQQRLVDATEQIQ